MARLKKFSNTIPIPLSKRGEDKREGDQVEESQKKNRKKKSKMMKKIPAEAAADVSPAGNSVAPGEDRKDERKEN